MELHYSYQDIHILERAMDKLVNGMSYNKLYDDEKEMINKLYDKINTETLYQDDMYEQSQDYDYGLDDDVDYDIDYDEE